MAATKLGSIKLTDSVLKGTADLATEVTGTLAVANGGTGQTVYTDGQLLIGNTTGNTLTKATLTAGTGVTITNGGGSITIAASGGGSDPWTYAKLPGSYTTTSASLATIINGGVALEFTPAANTDYEFVGVLMLRTSTASNNPRTAIAWSTGLIDGVGAIWQTGAAATTQVYASGSVAATIQIAVGGLPNNSADWPCFIEGTIRTGPSPSGTVSIQMAAETAGGTMTVRVGSFLRWRTI